MEKDKRDKKLPDEDLETVVAGSGENGRYYCEKAADNTTFVRYFDSNPVQCPNFQQSFNTIRVLATVSAENACIARTSLNKVASALCK